MNKSDESEKVQLQKSNRLNLPKRPSESRMKTTKLVSNNYRLNIENMTCYVYSLSFEPEIPEDDRDLRSKIVNHLKNDIKSILGGEFMQSGSYIFIFQRTIMASKTPLAPERFHVNTPPERRVDSQSYSISLQLVKEVEISEKVLQEQTRVFPEYFSKQSQESCQPNECPKLGNIVTQIISVILQSNIKNPNRYVQQNHRNSHTQFIDTISWKSFQNQLILHPGVSIQFSCNSNINIMPNYFTRIFRQQTALEFLSKNRSDIIGQVVRTEYNYYNYTIAGIDWQRTPLSKFFWDNINQEITFTEYYKTCYNKTIKDLNQPLLKVFIRKTNSQQKKYQQEIYLIPELCQMTGISQEMQSNHKTMKELAELTLKTPNEDFTFHKEFIKDLAMKSEYDKLYISRESEEFSGNVLDPPKFIQTQELIEIRDWIIIYYQNEYKFLEILLENLRKAGQQLKIKFHIPKMIEMTSKNVNAWEKACSEVFEQDLPPQLVLSFTEDTPFVQNTTLYGKLKNLFYNEIGVAHQHVRPSTLRQSQPLLSIASNIALQIAVKLNKTPYTVEYPAEIIESKTMLVGIGTSTKKIFNPQTIKFENTVGLVAQFGPNFNHHYTKVENENINSSFVVKYLSQFIKQSIKQYVSQMKNLPENIIVYRSGLGEGQIHALISREIEQIQQGFNEINKQYQPKMAYFIVSNKHGLKFYEKNDNPKLPNLLSNPQQGTLVPSENNNSNDNNNLTFYLCSQNNNKGVTTPVKYTSYINTTDFTQSMIWNLTYLLCFNYCNFKGPVRLPAPLAFANKVATFVSNIRMDIINNNLEKTIYYI